MSQRLTLFVLIVGLLLPTFAFAVRVTNLYQVALPVTSQTYDVREQAIREGFQIVLLKLTGDIAVLKNPAIQETLPRADYFVKDYNYAAAQTNSSFQYRLNIRYEQDQINQLLEKAGVSLWGDTRPLILVWLVLSDENGDDEIIGSEYPSRFLNPLMKQGKRMGLPLLFPMMDVSDIEQLSAGDVIERNVPTLQLAAKRYAAEGLLIGNVEKTANNLQSRWMLVVGDKEWGWKLDNKDVDELAYTIMNQVTQALNKNSVTKTTELPSSSVVTLVINNIRNQDDLTNLLQYLKQIPSVKQTQVEKISDRAVEVALLLHGSIINFQQSTETDKRLVFKSQDQDNNKLIYEWVH